jgi:DNA-binding NtrC family response regulator
LRAPQETRSIGLGPIAQALEARQYDDAIIISDYPRSKVNEYLKWLENRTDTKISTTFVTLTSPVNFGEIYEAAVKVVTEVKNGSEHNPALTFHLSPGTPAMAAVWIILAKTRFPAELIESSKEGGVCTASIPFDISAEFIPDLLRKPDEALERLSASLPPAAPEFADLVHRSRVMKRVIAKARRVALRSVPVLIEGESGTGKELLARAIHKAGPRREKSFVAVNCGAIPAELVEAELFGHEKGAFTGANTARDGLFKAADQGTLFLDEVGELPQPAQIKLLRALQEGEIVRVGSTKPVKVNVRIIAATNRTLTDEISQGRFRPDLFYRLAVAVIQLPPLRERPGDLGLLIDHLMDQVNRESGEEPGYIHKKISTTARNLLLAHGWPGNVRELLNTLRRAAIWSAGETITAEDMREAILPAVVGKQSDILNRPLGEELNLPELISNVAKHYLSRALDETSGNKTQAARLVGLPSYQTFTNWLQKYGVEA